MRYTITKIERHSKDDKKSEQPVSKSRKDLKGLSHTAPSADKPDDKGKEKKISPKGTEKPTDVNRQKKVAQAAAKMNDARDAKRRASLNHQTSSGIDVFHSPYENLSRSEQRSVDKMYAEQHGTSRIQKEADAAVKTVRDISSAVPLGGLAVRGDAAQFMAYSSTIAVDKAVEVYKRMLKAEGFTLTKQNMLLGKKLAELENNGAGFIADKYTELSKKLANGTITPDEKQRLENIVKFRGSEVSEYIAVKDQLNSNNKRLKAGESGNARVNRLSKTVSAAKRVGQALQSSDDTGDAVMAAASSLVTMPMHDIQGRVTQRLDEVLTKKRYLTQKGREKAEKKLAEKSAKDLEKVGGRLEKKLTKAAEKNDRKLKSDYAKRQEKAKKLKDRQDKSKAVFNSKKNLYLRANQFNPKFVGNKFNQVSSFLTKGGTKLLIAGGGGIAVVLLVVLGLVAPLFLAALFSWMSPHEDTLYDDDTRNYTTLNLTEEKEILEGYITHIRDYFDEKQIEILKQVEYKFGGFDPDDYKYNDFPVDPVVYETKYSILQYTTRYTTWTYDNPGLPNKKEEKDTPHEIPIFSTTYLKMTDDNREGFYTRVRSTDDWDKKQIKSAHNFDLNGYYKRSGYTGEVFTFSPSAVYLLQDISDTTIKKINSSGVVVWERPAADVLMDMSEPAVAFNLAIDDSQFYDKIYHTAGYFTEPTLLREKNELVSSSVVEKSVFDNGENTKYKEDLNIYNLNEFGNRWIKLANDVDFESIIAMAAIKKFQYMESDDFDETSYIYEITTDDINEVCDKLYSVSIEKRKGGSCACLDCNRRPVEGGWEYFCDRAATHVHLRGQVTNFTNYGFDYLLNRVLDMTVPTFEQDKEIFEVYKAYISDVLGTSTTIDDFENDESAQMRLYRKYLLDGGYLELLSPTDIKVSEPYADGFSFKSRTAFGGYGHEDLMYNFATGEYIFLVDANANVHVSWKLPEYDDAGEKPEVSGYKVYYISPTGKPSLLATVGADQTSADVLIKKFTYICADNGGILSPRLVGIGAVPTSNNLNSAFRITVVSYNSEGESEKDKENAPLIQAISAEQMLQAYEPMATPIITE